METLLPHEEFMSKDTLDDIALTAFIGALDDIILASETTDYNERQQGSGGTLAEQVLGLFNTASTFYDEDMNRNIRLINGLAARLAERAFIDGCGGHNSLGITAGTMDLTLGGFLNGEVTHENHDHNDDEDDEIDPRTGKKKKRKV